MVRLNYSIDLRYGVLVDLARKILDGTPIDLGMGYVNVIWQGDALDHIVRCLPHASAPPWIINVTGRYACCSRALAKTPHPCSVAAYEPR